MKWIWLLTHSVPAKDMEGKNQYSDIWQLYNLFFFFTMLQSHDKFNILSLEFDKNCFSWLYWMFKFFFLLDNCICLIVLPLFGDLGNWKQLQ